MRKNQRVWIHSAVVDTQTSWWPPISLWVVIDMSVIECYRYIDIKHLHRGSTNMWIHKTTTPFRSLQSSQLNAISSHDQPPGGRLCLWSPEPAWTTTSADVALMVRCGLAPLAGAYHGSAPDVWMCWGKASKYIGDVPASQVHICWWGYEKR